MRRWQEGEPFETGDGLLWRVARGQKTPGDLVLLVRGTQRWNKIKMATGLLIADFMTENEDVLRDEGYFPPSADGGRYYLRHLEMAARHGWRAVAEKLEAERKARRVREAPLSTPAKVHSHDWQESDIDVFRCAVCDALWGVA
jgi:hypothetical protein